MNKIQIAVDCIDSRKDYEIFTSKPYDKPGHTAHWHERVGLSSSRGSLADLFGLREDIYPTEREAITAAFLACLDHASQWEDITITESQEDKT